MPWSLNREGWKLKCVRLSALACFSSLLCFGLLNNPIWLLRTAVLLTLHFMLSWGSVINIPSVDNETGRKISGASTASSKPINPTEMPWLSHRGQIPAGIDARLSLLLL